MSNALLEHHLRSLRLPTMLANYRLIAEQANQFPISPIWPRSNRPNGKRMALKRVLLLLDSQQ
jgi:hypothetical protein